MKHLYHKILLSATLTFILTSLSPVSSQIVVSLDHWFNNETHEQTNKPFHYLWSDTAVSGYSEWADIFKSREAVIATMGKPSTTALWKTDVYIIADPDSTNETSYPNYISTSDINSIRTWVRQGGVLAILANDAFNCEFTNLNRLMSEFGMSFNKTSMHIGNDQGDEKGKINKLPDHPLFKDVSGISMEGASDINIRDNAKAVLTENGRIIIAENKFGKGYVIAVGDPWICNKNLMLPGRSGNRKAAENLTDLLLSYVRIK